MKKVFCDKCECVINSNEKIGMVKNILLERNMTFMFKESMIELCESCYTEMFSFLKD